MMMSLLACCLLCVLVLLSTVNSLPIPLKLLSLDSKNDQKNTENELYEYFNEEFVSPKKCEDICTFTYPAHTYPVVDHHLACKQGCVLAQLGTATGSCQLECSELYNTEDEQYACGVGCNSPSLQTESNLSKQRTLISISSVKISSYGFFNLKERLKNLLWGNSYQNEIKWDQKEVFNLENGEELLVLKGHGYKSNAEDLLSAGLNSQALQALPESSLQPTLVYVSKSILRTFYYESSFDRILSYIGILLMLITAPLLAVSIYLDCRKNQPNVEEETKHDKELAKTTGPICTSFEPLPEKLPYFQPVSVYVEDIKN